MPFLLWVLFEATAFWWISKAIGLGWTFIAYFAPILVGLILLSTLSRSFLRDFQQSVASGHTLPSRMLSLGCRLVAGALFLLPFLVPRIFAVFLLIPGAGFLAFVALQAWLLRRMKAGQFVFMRAGDFSRTHTDGAGGSFRYSQSEIRDVYEATEGQNLRVIDLPRESVTIKKS